MNIKTKFLAGLVLAFVLSLMPRPAYACDSLLCLGDIFGWTDVAKVHSDRDQQLANIKAKQAQDVARINADAQARIAEANREIEAQRVQGQISAANAKAMADAFAATVNAKRDEYIGALTQNAQVAISGINQTGETERSRIGWQAKTDMLTIVIVGILVLFGLGIAAYMLNKRQGPQPPQQVVVMLAGSNPQHRQLERPQTIYLPRNQVNLIEEDKHYENR